MPVIGDLVANLVATTTGFTGPLSKAQGVVGKFSSGVVKGFGAIPGLLGGITGMLGPFAAAFGAGAIVNAGRDAFQAQQKLASSLASTGGAAGVSAEEIKILASDLQRLTNFEDDATIAAAGVLATFTNIKGDVFKAAIVSAQDLSAKMGTDLQSSIVQVGKALNDPIKGVTALQRVGVSFTAEQKAQIKQLQQSGNIIGAQAIVMAELQKEFGGTAQAMADPLTQLQNILGDVAEGLAAMILPSLNAVAQAIMGSIVPSSQTMGEWFTYVGTVLADYVKVAIDFVRDAVIVVAFAIENFGKIAEYAFLNAALFAVQFANEVSHFFTGVLPALLTWFSSNWQAVWFTAVDFVLTAFINLGQNIRNIMSEVWDFISSGGTDSFDPVFVGLTEGFKSAISELPDIPERAIGALEAQLGQDVNRIGTELGDALGEAMLAGTAETVKPVLPEFGKGGFGEGGGTGGAAEKGGAKEKGPEAAVFGSKEALSSIFSAMRQSSVQDQMLRTQERGLEVQEEIRDAILDLEGGELIAGTI